MLKEIDLPFFSFLWVITDTLVSHNRPELLGPSSRGPLLTYNTKHKIASRLDINFEEKYIDKLTAEMDLKLPTSEFLLAKQPLKHKIKLASMKVNKETRNSLFPIGNPEYLLGVDKFPHFISRKNFDLTLPAWQNDDGSNTWYVYLSQN